jgi:hypothetical protein
MMVPDEQVRRVAILRMPISGLVRLFVSGLKTTIEPEDGALPDDVRVVGHHLDPLTADWEVLLESKTFAAVPLNAVPPYLPYPTIRVSHERVDAMPAGDRPSEGR